MKPTKATPARKSPAPSNGRQGSAVGRKKDPSELMESVREAASQRQRELFK